MTGLAELELAVRGERRFDLIEAAYLHRATLDETLAFTRGRPQLIERRMADVAEGGGGPATILADLGGMIAFETAAGWRGHRWADREGGRIAAETLIVDGAARAACLGRDGEAEARRLAALHPVHAPLGELRPGRGQFATDPAPALPHGWPAAAIEAATLLHRSWNGREIDAMAAPAWRGPAGRTDHGDWLLGLLIALPDAVLLFDRAAVRDDRVAILWRLHGHHLGAGLCVPPTGRRVRAIGSCLIRTGGDGAPILEETMIDTLALEAQILAPLIDYAA